MFVLVAQVSAAFALWIVSGWLFARRAARWRPILSKYSRKVRVALGPVLMIWAVSALPLGAGLIAKVQGIDQGVLTLAGWLIVAVTGMIFIAGQTLAALVMVSIAAENEPARIAQASEGRINDRNSHES